METSEKANENAEKLEKERVFLANLAKISRLDSLVTEISTLFDEGLADLAYLRYKNQTFGDSLTARTYKEGPAFRLLRLSEANAYKLEENLENLRFFPDFFEESEENPKKIESSDDFPLETHEKTGLLQENELQTLEKSSADERILGSFGISNRDPVIYHAQRTFLRCTERLLELKREFSLLNI